MKKILMIIGLLAVVGVAVLLFVDTDSSNTNEGEQTATETKGNQKYASLGGVFTKAMKACGNECGSESDCDDECGSDDLEFLDFEVVTDEDDGSEIPVAYFRTKGEIFQLVDVDSDGMFDIAVFDSDDDEDISDDEIIDVSDERISVSDIAEYAGDGSYESYGSSDDDDDEEESIVERTSRERSTPSRQRSEAADENDLPDYVNNARVKAMIKRK